MEWSHYSEAIFNNYLTTDSNLLVQACPGSGKTTNIKHLWSLDDKPTVYLVFNKHNQLEAEAKMQVKPSSAVLTLNGLGHRAIVGNFGRVNLDTNKVMDIIKKHIRYDSKAKLFDKQHMLRRAVAMAKMYCLDLEPSQSDYWAMLSQYDLDDYPGMYHHLLRCLDISDSMTQTIDYADQIRLPALFDLAMPQYHNILCDEVQDFSPIQAKMVSKLQGQKYIFVGDSHQSIYGFRGAMNDSMDRLGQQFTCVTLPLSISYRCPSSVVAEAAVIYPDIEPWSEAKLGTVSTGPVSLDSYTADTLVLCRLNRPLVTLAFTLLRSGTACHVRGRDIGDNLIRLIKRQDAGTVSQLIDSLGTWAETEIYKAQLKDDDAKIQSIHDKYDSIMVFCEQCQLSDAVAVVIDKINSLFEQGRGCCLSTIHKAKGLEANKVYWLEHSLSMRSRQSWQAVQERNLQYVAVTRSQDTLVYM